VPAVNRNSFAVKLIGQFIGLINGRNRRLFGEIYGLADRRVTVLLKCRLHPDMPLGPDIIRTSENSPNFGWNLRNVLNTACPGNLFFQLFAVKTVLFSYSFEDRIYLQDFQAAQQPACKNQRIGRLNTGGTIRDDTYRTGRSYARNGSIVETFSVSLGSPDTVIPIRKRPTQIGKSVAGLARTPR